MNYKLFEVLMEEYQNRMKVLAEALARGSCANHEEYKYICGQLRGLETACSVIADLKQRWEQLDE